MQAQRTRKRSHGGPPAGMVALLFTDIEGSTRLATAQPDQYAKLLQRHREILRAAFAESNGVEVGTEGDSFFVTFSSPVSALRAAAKVQRDLHNSDVGTAGVAVRIGVHVGEVVAYDGGYVGVEIHRAARMSAVGHGGQVLVSDAVAAIVGDSLPGDLALRDLGEFRLKDFESPTRIYQLTGPGLGEEFPVLRAAGRDLTNVPREVTSFVGRKSELAELEEIARSHRLITLVGAGGTGKTRLMLKAAEAITRPADGTWFVELAPVRNSDRVALEIARVLGLQQESGQNPSSSLTDFLRSKHVLLLLDNCEQVVGSVAVITEALLAACPHLSVLASSREALDIAGETVFPVPPLDVGSPREANSQRIADPAAPLPLAVSDAVQLFADRARNVLPTFELDSSNLGAITAICAHLDGIPLAIELAAARVALLSVEEILEGLEDRFRLLDSGRRTADSRQRTLRGLIDWSWDLLDEMDQRLLRRLSVFSGGWTLKAAAAVAVLPEEIRADNGRAAPLPMLDALGHLVAKSLVLVEHGEPSRYRLLETIREYAGERLANAGETDATKALHLAHYLEFAEEAADELKGPDMAKWIGRVEGEIDNFRAALDWAFEVKAEDAMKLCVALFWYWRSTAVSESVSALERAVELIPELAQPAAAAPNRERALVAKVLAAAASTQATSGESGAAMEWADRSVAIARTAGDPTAVLEALTARALAHVWSTFSSPMADLLEAVAIADAVGDWWAIGMLRANLAQGAFYSGDPQTAETELVKATAAAQRSHNPFVLAYVSFIRGRVSESLGHFGAATRALETAIATYEALGDRRFALIARSELAHVIRRGGLLDEARQLYEETLAGWQFVGSRGAMANQLECIAYLALALDDVVRATHLLAAAESIRDEGSSPMLPYEQQEYDAAIDELRSRLKPAALDSAWAAGRGLTMEQAVTLALSPSTSAGAPNTV